MAGADDLDVGRKRPRVRLAVASVALAVGALGATSSELGDGAIPRRDDAVALGRSDVAPQRKRVQPRPAPLVPTVSATQRAWRYARRRGGLVSLAVADSARMRDFSVAGYWGNAQITAIDMARFFSRVRGLLPRPYRKAGLGMLASVVREQRWGLPRAARGDWSVYFKGGWRATESGELVHQAAWLWGSSGPGHTSRRGRRVPCPASPGGLAPGDR